jgi:ADP-ribosyl-[dinitrogen reductase] hydrolase
METTASITQPVLSLE